MQENPKTNKSAVAGLYNQVAGTFDRVGPETFGVFGRILVQEAQLEPGMRVLDIGAGRGANLFPAARAVGISGLAVGIDLAGEMVRLTNNELRQEAVPQAAVLQMDAERLAFPSAAFDALLCGFAIFFLDPTVALPEWRRVLRPGGSIAISVSAGSDPRWAWYEQTLVAYHEKHGFPLSSGGRGLRRPPDILAALAGAGFADPTGHLHEIDIHYPDAETWWQAKWTHGSRYPLDHMPPDVLPRFQQEVLSHAREMDLTERWTLSCIRAKK